jgi:DNA-binding SARP family transcriptional activator
VSIELLGPLRVDGHAVSFQRRDQVVLSALAVQAGEVVAADRLAEALWGEEPPPSWRKIVQGCVLRLRKALGPSLIETTAAGYRLTIAADELDSGRFEQLVDRGRSLAASGEPDRAAVAFDRALELWRGSPFEVLDGWAPGRIEATRLEEQRRSAEESVLDVRLQVGEHRDVVAIAEARVAEEPLREHRWAILALALYRCGRQADSLRALKRARSTLVEQLGIEPGSELVGLEAAILTQDDLIAAVTAPPAVGDHCPYKGLVPYDVDDSETFFGRNSEVAACLERLRANPLLVVTGPSGCGKSSLVRAGLVPALQRAGHTVSVFTPGSDPGVAMTNALAASKGTPVLVVDQFEELFTSVDDGAAARQHSLCARLAGYAMTGAPVVVTVRADHVAALAIDEDFAALAERGLHLVKPLAGDSLREAIQGPAATVGLRLEPGLVDLLVRDCEGEPGALPLLSHALAETWQRRDGRVLTVEGYRATGEIRGAVARSADRLYESLPAEQRPKLRSMLLRLVAPSPDGEPVRSRVPTRSLGGDADRDRVLGLLVRARLVTSEEDSVELAHEALARAWPRLRSWLDEDAAGQRILRHLSTAADGWESLGRPSTELYRGARLEAVLEWRDATSPDLTEQESAFLDASVAEAASERGLLAERARHQARQNRRLRRSLIGVAVLLVAAIVGGVLAYQQRQTARREERDAALTALTSNSAALRSNRRDLAALLAVEAHRLAPGAATESALFGTFTASPGAVHTVHTAIDTHAIGAVFVGTDSVAVTDDVGAVHLVDLATGQRRQFDALVDEDDISVATWSTVAGDAQGRYLAALWRPLRKAPGSEYSLLTVWDVATGERRFDAVRIPYLVSSMAISEDGATLVVGGGRWGRVQVHDGATGQLLRQIGGLPRPGDAWLEAATAAVAFTPDGDLAIGSLVGPVRIVDPYTGAERRRLNGPQETSNFNIFFTRDGTEMITLGVRGFMRFDVASGEPASPEPHPVPYCGTWAYAERIGALLCGDVGQLAVFDVATGLEVGRRFDSQHGDVCGLAMNDDGTSLAEVSSCVSNATIVEWRLDGGGPISRLVVDTRGDRHVGPFGVGGDADALATEFIAPGDGTPITHVVDASSGDIIDRLPDTYRLLPTDDQRRAVTYFPEDGTVGWYDTEQRTRVGPGIELDHEFAYAAAGDGHILVAAFDDGIDGILLQGVDLDAGRLVPPTIDGRGQFWSDVAFGPDAIYTAIEAWNDDPVFEVQRRDVSTGDVLESQPGFGSVAAAGGIVVASTVDGRIYELDPMSLDPVGVPFPGIDADTNALGIDERGRRLMVLGRDERLRFYDVATRVQLGDAIDLAYQYALHPAEDVFGSGAVLRSDGLRAAAVTEQGIVVWDLDPAHWVDAACQLAGRNLTHAEWDQYIGDLAPYRPSCPEYTEDGTP